MARATRTYRVEFMAPGGDWGWCEVSAASPSEAEAVVLLSRLVSETQPRAHATHVFDREREAFIRL